MALFYPIHPKQVYLLWKKISSSALGALPGVKVSKMKGNLFEDLVITFLHDLGFPPPIAGRASPVLGISSVRHEHDIIIRPRKATGNDFILFECKYRKKGSVISKEDVMIFNQKALDIRHIGKIKGVTIRHLHRLFVSYVPLDHNAFRFCLTHGILVLQPFYSRRVYPSKVACYPPLQAVYWNLKKRANLISSVPRREMRDLEQNVLRLMKATFRETSELPTSRKYDGATLHRKYLDIILRMNSYVDGNW